MSINYSTLQNTLFPAATVLPNVLRKSSDGILEAYGRSLPAAGSSGGQSLESCPTSRSTGHALSASLGTGPRPAHPPDASSNLLAPACRPGPNRAKTSVATEAFRFL